MPVAGTGDQRSLMPLAHDGSLPETRAQRRCAGKYLVAADIANFYPSVYTHSVAWAIETKPVSKARLLSKGTHPFADALDAGLRACQYGQTVGLPVGPDTSLVVAELVLSEVDRLVVAGAPPSAGLRYYDDYELSYPTHAQALQGLATLQGVLAEFQLQLNRKKTRVVELLQPLDSPWVNTLRAYSIESKDEKTQRGALIAYFDLLTELSAAYPDDNVIEYGIGRLWREVAAKTFLGSNLTLLQHLVMQVLLARPSASTECYHLLLLLQGGGVVVDTASLGAGVNALIAANARLGYGSEVAWAVWGSMVFRSVHLGLTRARPATWHGLSGAAWCSVCQSKRKPRNRFPPRPTTWWRYWRWMLSRRGSSRAGWTRRAGGAQ